VSSVEPLAAIVRRLRAPDGCPWDREQTHESLRSCLIEECYEAIEAINGRDDENLREELGDVLLQVVMHSEMASERDAFDIDSVVAGICEKLVRRHPHVFGDAKVADSKDVLKNWEQIKREEKGGSHSVFTGLTKGLPALLRAQTAQKKAARVGFDWPDPSGATAKIHEELDEVLDAATNASARPERLEDEIGDLLFAAVNLARHYKVDAETALSAATEKFIRRFQFVEDAVAVSGRRVEECSLDELEDAWERAKRDEQ